MYSLKLIFFSFLSPAAGFKRAILKVKENENFFNLFPLMVLTVFSIFSGFLFNFFFNSKFEVFFENSIFISHFNIVPKRFL